MRETVTKPKHRLSYRFAALAWVALLFVAANQQQDLKELPDLKMDCWEVQSPERKAKIIAHLNAVPDVELKKVFDGIVKLHDFRSRAGYEPCLNEMVRRGGQQWELFLKDKLDTLMKSKIKLYEDEDDDEDDDEEKNFEPGSLSNLELLTALRRIKKQPDPLQVLIDGPQELTVVSSALALPQLGVRVKNVDVDKTDVGLTFGGNYRSGRQSRWRVVAQDEKDNVIPIRTHIGFSAGGVYVTNGGGISSTGALKHGKSWETSLSVGSFIDVPPPGKYKLIVYYHNTQTIAGESTVEGSILSQSKPVTLTVLPITITQSKEDRAEVTRLVSKLDGTKRLKIVAGTYGEWAHKLVSPDSPAGQLLGMGLKAVPTLVQSLRDEALTTEKRAWLFGILFSLTGENDPARAGVLGSYDFLESGWRIQGGTTGEPPLIGFSWKEPGSVISWGKIDGRAQEELIKTWEKWLKKVEVKERDVDDEQNGQGGKQ